MLKTDKMTREDLSIALEDALQAIAENYQEASENSGDAFQAGRELAYYEVLDILRSRIEIHGGEMHEVKQPRN